MIVSRLFLIAPVLLLSATAYAQRPSDYQNRCQQETANRLRLNQRDVFTNLQGNSGGRTRVNWTARGREGFCVIDNRMTVVDFQETTNGRGGKGGGPQQPVDIPRMRMDTSGRGTFNDGGGAVRITRGWIDTRNQQPSVTLSGEKNFKITFWGDITRSNGREFTMRITRSDRGNANGTATFRVNGDRNEVELINLDGRVNNRNFNGSFSR